MPPDKFSSPSPERSFNSARPLFTSDVNRMHLRPRFAAVVSPGELKTRLGWFCLRVRGNFYATFYGPLFYDGRAWFTIRRVSEPFYRLLTLNLALVVGAAASKSSSSMLAEILHRPIRALTFPEESTAGVSGKETFTRFDTTNCKIEEAISFCLITIRSKM